MLNSLEIKNFALIDSAFIDFSDKLNILSGETGSGKSVILDSLNFVLGAKADKNIIRTGCMECFVCAEFNITKNFFILNLMEEFGFDKDDNLIISRKYNIDGKNTIRINGMTANVSMLKKFTSNLIDVHGQSEHYSLLSVTNQLKLLDDFGKDKVLDKLCEIKKLSLEYKTLINKLNSFGGSESERAIKLDLINYQIKEINSAEIKENEEEDLLDKKQKALNYQKIQESLSDLKSSFSDDGNVLDILSNATRVVGNIEKFSSDYSTLSERINSLYSESDDISDCIQNFIENLDGEELNLDEIENRLSVINQIKKKYGENFCEIQKFLQNIILEKTKIENFTEEYEKIILDKNKLEDKIVNNCFELHKIRLNIADKLKTLITNELKSLGMLSANFDIVFSQFQSNKELFNFNNINSFENIKFMFSANKGEPLKDLSQVISGGEISRLMLAIKSISAQNSEIETYIFDEIDAGISGKIAEIVAEKLYKISKYRQVIAITHLPQICVFADRNFLISKIENFDKTLSSVSLLDENNKVNEIIRLVGGNIESINSINHAKELINKAKIYKESN